MCIFLAYYRNYRTMEDIANEYEISVSTTYDIIKLVEKHWLHVKNLSSLINKN
ncbi:MAG: transposase family protein [Synergistaceae bacterium]|nr:transposase family protein [Synergistaceae bacterium]